MGFPGRLLCSSTRTRRPRAPRRRRTEQSRGSCADHNDVIPVPPLPSLAAGGLRVTLANHPFPPSPNPATFPAPCSLRAPAGGAEDHQRQTDGRRPRPSSLPHLKWAEKPEGDATGSGDQPARPWTSSCSPRRMPASSTWLCQHFGGFFIRTRVHTMRIGILIPATNEIVQDFADLLAVIASAAGDSRIDGTGRRPSGSAGRN